jgi:hypothetical protein
MQLFHSTVILETQDGVKADITILVRSDDDRLSELVHEICRSAVKRAISPLDMPATDRRKMGAGPQG